MKTDESNNKHNQPYPTNKEKNVSNIVSTQMARKTFIKQRIWDEENKTYTFSWWFWEEMKQQWSWKWVTRCVWEVSDRKDNEQSQSVRGKTEKDLKTAPILPNTRFSWLKWVADQSPGQAAKTLKDKILKKFSKCFSRLEGLPARESRVELWEFLCNPRD